MTAAQVLTIVLFFIGQIEAVVLAFHGKWWTAIVVWALAFALIF